MINQNHCNSAISFNGTEQLLKYKVINRQFPKLDAASFATMAISSTGHLLGGAGLLYDVFLFKDLNSKNKLFYSEHSEFNQITFKPFVQETKVEKKKSETSKIEPKSKIGKLALTSAKLGIGVAGIAGIFNGMSMGLPLLSIGEGFTTLASPTIETITGLGLFGLGLATINLARILDTDSRFKIDRGKFQSLSWGKRIKYIGENISDTTKELMVSLKKIGKNFKNLFGKDKQESIEFFKSNIFSFKQRELLIQEFINKDGKVTIRKALKASPYLMHFATAILTLGSVGLIVSGLIKNAKAEKTSLRLYNVGNSVDNIALVRWGVEKNAISSVPSYRISGKLTSIAGASILASQPGIEKEWGRGLVLSGVGLLLAGFALERGHDMRKALNKFQEPLSAMVRQWRIDLDKLFTNAELREKVGDKTCLDSILDAVKKGQEIKTPKLKTIIDKLTNSLTKSEKYIETPEITVDNVELFSKPSNYRATLDTLQKQSNAMFGEKPIMQMVNS